MGLLGEHRWGIPIVFLSACLAIPPLYAVTLAVPATRMSIIPFGVAVRGSGQHRPVEDGTGGRDPDHIAVDRA